ncbi:hypothetical protein D083_0564 [Dickeya solani RNS 08.23.3.1.A]|nr:hypothetical protein D083_0564 [Dickeya solani RNS 08.23.3.1.A]
MRNYSYNYEGEKRAIQNLTPAKNQAEAQPLTGSLLCMLHNGKIATANSSREQ